MVWKKRASNHFQSLDPVYAVVGKAVSSQQGLSYVSDD